jgi:hypothetical protein
MSIFKCPCGNLATKILTVCDECSSKIEGVSPADTKTPLDDVADTAALKWYGVYGKAPTDSKSYRELVSTIREAILKYYSSKKEMKCFDTVISYLEAERKPMVHRRKALSSPNISSNHEHEIVELDRQINEIDMAIKVLIKS